MLETIRYNIACIGNYTKDEIISPSGTRYVDGGAVNYSAHAAARLGQKVAVFTHLAREDQRVVRALEGAGVDCFVTYSPQSTLMKLVYPTNNVDIRALYVAATADAFEVSEAEAIRAQAVIIGTSFRGEVSSEVIRSLRKNNPLLVLDVQGFVRVLREGTLVYEAWDEMQATLASVDILKSDAVEAEFLTGESEIHKAAQAYAAMGVKEVVLTHKDGLLVYAKGKFHESGFYPQQMDGRSGRGDTCIGSYVATRLSKTPAEASLWAAAVTSLKMETLGPFNRSLAEIEDLIRRKYRNGSSNRQTGANQPEAA
jgi:sugar/nucleoside kinase (ribokinase family)